MKLERRQIRKSTMPKNAYYSVSGFPPSTSRKGLLVLMICGSLKMRFIVEGSAMGRCTERPLAIVPCSRDLIGKACLEDVSFASPSVLI